MQCLLGVICAPRSADDAAMHSQVPHVLHTALDTTKRAALPVPSVQSSNFWRVTAAPVTA